MSNSKELLKVICRFSEEFGVNHPESCDIGVWWDKALIEMDEEWVYFLYENNFCGDTTNAIAREMRRMLEARVFEIESEKVHLLN